MRQLYELSKFVDIHLIFDTFLDPFFSRETTFLPPQTDTPVKKSDDVIVQQAIVPFLGRQLGRFPINVSKKGDGTNNVVQMDY